MAGPGMPAENPASVCQWKIALLAITQKSILDMILSSLLTATPSAPYPQNRLLSFQCNTKHLDHTGKDLSGESGM